MRAGDLRARISSFHFLHPTSTIWRNRDRGPPPAEKPQVFPRVYRTHVGRLKFQCPIVVWRWSKPQAEESRRPRIEKKADTVSQNQPIAGNLQDPPDTGVLYLQFLLYTQAAPAPSFHLI